MSRSLPQGVSLVEVVITSMVMAVLAIPLITLSTQEQMTTQRAQLYYLSLVAAREEMYDARFLAASGAPLTSLEHDWKPLKGPSFAKFTQAGVVQGGVPDTKYQERQERIETEVKLKPGAGRIRLGTVKVRYETKGKGVGQDKDGNALELPFSIHLPGEDPCK